MQHSSNITWIIPKEGLGHADYIKVNGTNEVMDLGETNEVVLKTMTSKKQCWAIVPYGQWFRIIKPSCNAEEVQRVALYLTAKNSKSLTIEGMFEM